MKIAVAKFIEMKWDIYTFKRVTNNLFYSIEVFKELLETCKEAADRWNVNSEYFPNTPGNFSVKNILLYGCSARCETRHRLEVWNVQRAYEENHTTFPNQILLQSVRRHYQVFPFVHIRNVFDWLLQSSFVPSMEPKLIHRITSVSPFQERNSNFCTELLTNIHQPWQSECVHSSTVGVGVPVQWLIRCRSACEKRILHCVIMMKRLVGLCLRLQKQ